MGNSSDGLTPDSLVGRMSRRRAFGTLAASGIATGLAATSTRSLLAQDEPPSSQLNPDGTTPFNYLLWDAIPKSSQGGTVRPVTVKQMPRLAGLAINLLEIAPGALREVHWHPNASEISYCLNGQGTIGILSASGDNATFPIAEGSITFVPTGDAHYIQNTGAEALSLLIGFSHEAPQHIGLSQALPWVPSDLLNQTLGVEAGTLPTFPPRGDLGVVDLAGPSAPSTGSAATPFSSPLDALLVQTFAGGTVQPLRTDNIARLSGMTLLRLIIDGKSIREPHWHGNAAELNYCASGTAQVGIVAPSGESWTFTVTQGDVAYIPNNWFHYIANLDDEPLVFLAFLDNMAPNRVDLSTMTGFFPPEVLAASVGADPEVFARLPEQKTVVIAPPLPADDGLEITPESTPSS